MQVVVLGSRDDLENVQKTISWSLVVELQSKCSNLVLQCTDDAEMSAESGYEEGDQDLSDEV